MEIEATSADRNLLLELKGELDHHGARDALRELELAIDAALPKKLVLDLSCRKKDGRYYIVTDRWQKYTRVSLSPDILTMLASFCDEFLIHGVDVEGTKNGVEEELIEMLGSWNQIPITYAGGIRSFEDIDKIRRAGNGKIHITVGSALDLYGGNLPFEQTVAYTQQDF